MTTVINGTSTSASAPAVVGDDGNSGVYFPSSDQVAIATNGTQAVLVDSSQQVGIGATPGTWSTSKVLQIGSAGAFSGQTGAKTAEMTCNANLNSGWKFLTSGDYASLYYQYNGAHTFASSTSTGSAGAGVTWSGETSINQYGIGLNSSPASSGIGIRFPATQSASSDANTLDDYEEGTWTPTWTGAGGSSYTTTGAYLKVGRLVFITIQVNASGGSFSSTENSTRFNSFPFSMTSSAGYQSTLAVTSNYIQNFGIGTVYATNEGYTPTFSVTGRTVIISAVYWSAS